MNWYCVGEVDHVLLRHGTCLEGMACLYAIPLLPAVRKRCCSFVFTRIAGLKQRLGQTARCSRSIVRTPHFRT